MNGVKGSSTVEKLWKRLTNHKNGGKNFQERSFASNVEWKKKGKKTPGFESKHAPFLSLSSNFQAKHTSVVTQILSMWVLDSHATPLSQVWQYYQYSFPFSCTWSHEKCLSLHGDTSPLHTVQVFSLGNCHCFGSNDREREVEADECSQESASIRVTPSKSSAQSSRCVRECPCVSALKHGIF